MDTKIAPPCQRALLLENDEAGGRRICGLLAAGGPVREVKRILSLSGLCGELQTGQPDLILAEHPLRSIDGLAVLRLRNHYAPGLPLIFISDAPGDEDVIEALCLGCNAAVFWGRLESLPAMLRRIVAGMSLEREPDEDGYEDGYHETDPATGLYTRQGFVARLAALCHARRAAGGSLTLVEIAVGATDAPGSDEHQRAAILEHTVERLLNGLDAGDTLGRLGAFRFASVRGEGSEPAQQWLPLLLERLRDPILIDGQFWSLPVYCGCASYPADGLDAPALLRIADAALQRAEREAEFRYCVRHAPPPASQQHQIEDELRAALTPDGGLQLLYQPQAELAGGHIIGLEALLCWHHPRLGTLKAGDFIPLAEFCGLMPLLDCWVLNQACLQLRQWREAGLQPPCLSLNLSPGLFASGTLIGDLERTLTYHGIEAGALELGLSEAATLRDPALSVGVMVRLRTLGLKLSLKDFGSGYSSLLSLKRYPLTRLKLDRCFVQGIANDPGDLAVVRAIIALAHELCLDVVAEGVETREQLSLLVAARCEALQGYLFSPPVSAEACRGMMAGGFALLLD